jgi:hypothetical protein
VGFPFHAEIKECLPLNSTYCLISGQWCFWHVYMSWFILWTFINLAEFYVIGHNLPQGITIFSDLVVCTGNRIQLPTKHTYVRGRISK